MTEFTNYQVNVELIADEKGSFISLEQQNSYEDPATVYLHPWQLRAACEHFGIIASDHGAAKSIALLERRLMALRDRVEALHGYLLKHPDPILGVAYATATLHIANEFCIDLEKPGIPSRPHKAHQWATKSQ